MVKNNKLKLNIANPNYSGFQNRSIDSQLPPLVLEGETLNNVTHTKLLGVNRNKNLNWNSQINNVYSKSSKMCGILYKARNHLTTELMISIYYYVTLILYTVCTWRFFINKLKIAQYKILRCIFNRGKFDSTYNSFSDYRL